MWLVWVLVQEHEVWNVVPTGIVAFPVITPALVQPICRQVLDEELGVDPSSETSDLHMQILNDEVPSQMALTVPADPVSLIPPFQAPQLTQHFVGRQAEIDQMTDQIAGRVGLIGLVGMGGIGKTTLATRLAHGLKDDFPDGVLWADAANSEPLDILGSWATAYGYDFSGLGDVNNRAAAVRGMLADKRCLIVLDDVALVYAKEPLVTVDVVLVSFAPLAQAILEKMVTLSLAQAAPATAIAPLWPKPRFLFDARSFGLC